MKEARIVTHMHCQVKNTRKGVLHGRDKTLSKCDTSETFLKIGVYVKLLSIMPTNINYTLNLFEVAPSLRQPSSPRKTLLQSRTQILSSIIIILGRKNQLLLQPTSFQKECDKLGDAKNTQKKKRQHLKHRNLDKKHHHFHHVYFVDRMVYPIELR